MNFSMQRSQNGGTVIFSCSGSEFTLADARKLLEAFRADFQNGFRNFILDFKGATICSIAFGNAFSDVLDAVKSGNAKLGVINLSPVTASRLKLSAIYDRCDIYPSESAALHSSQFR